MEEILINGGSFRVAITATETGWFLRVPTALLLEAGETVVVYRRWKLWRANVRRFLQFPAGEQVSWLWLTELTEQQSQGHLGKCS